MAYDVTILERPLSFDDCSPDNVLIHGDGELTEFKLGARCIACNENDRTCILKRSDRYRCISCAAINAPCEFMRPVLLSRPPEMLPWSMLTCKSIGNIVEEAGKVLGDESVFDPLREEPGAFESGTITSRNPLRLDASWPSLAQKERVLQQNPSSRSTTRIHESLSPFIPANINNQSTQDQNRKLQCPHCSEQPGFRGEHELRRHIERAHATVRKAWICVDASPDGKFLGNCKQCRNQKRYGADYNAAAHLRRVHFNSREDPWKRAGYSGGNEPSMEYLKAHWMKEVDETAGAGSTPLEVPDDTPSEDQASEIEHEDESYRSISNNPKDSTHRDNVFGPLLSSNLSARAEIKCPDCGKSFRGKPKNAKANLARHQEEQHRQTEPLPCPVCAKTFTRRGNLDQHMQIKHGQSGKKRRRSLDVAIQGFQRFRS